MIAADDRNWPPLRPYAVRLLQVASTAPAGVDLDRANIDLTTYAVDIDAALERNNDQAKAFGFQGTPAFIIGTFRTPMVIDEAAFRQVIGDARIAAKK